DVGRVRLFSNAQPIRRPSDLRQVRPWAWRDEVVLTSLLDAAGANPVRLGVPEVYPALQTGMIDTVFSTGVAAVSLQWYTRLDYVTRESRGVAVGATILKRGVYEELPTELREALDRTADKAHAALRSAIRRDDERAYRVMTERGMREVSVTEFEDEWEALERKVRERLTGRLFPASLLERVARAGRGGNPAGG
ncbi:MAG: TRAP transporter substrate-binding protein DctP, partial [Myxococcota bacterium]